jgi:signal transduction histidine kinase
MLIPAPLRRLARAAASLVPGRGRGGPDAAALPPTQDAVAASLQAADRLAAVGRLSRGLSHEINNPLAIVRANIEFAADELAHGTGTLTEVRAALEEASAATLRIAQVVKDLAAFARDPGDDPGPADLGVVLPQVLRLVRAELAAHARVELRAPDGPLLVRGSAQALAHVLSRLVLDGASAYPPDMPLDRAVVDVSVVRRGAVVVVEVKDQGLPIPPEILPHVFDPFFQAIPGFAFGASGRGIGVSLSACRGLVEAAGGALDVDSGGRAGTTFRVRLPIATSSTRLQLRPASAPPRPRERVLVVHEEPVALAGLYRLLTDRFLVVPHTSATHVLSLLGAGERFDAAVCDLGLREVEASAFVAGIRLAAPALAAATVFLESPASPAPDWVRALPNPRVAGTSRRELVDAVTRCLGSAGASATRAGTRG